MVEKEIRNQYPFIRPHIRAEHLIPVVGGIKWFAEERRLKAETVGGKGLTAPLPQTRKEFVEDLKTQAIHGSMLGYHASFAVLVGSGVATVLTQILFRTESSKR